MVERAIDMFCNSARKADGSKVSSGSAQPDCPPSRLSGLRPAHQFARQCARRHISPADYFA